MAKFCSNGHQMEDSWPECPYCMKTGYNMANAGEAGKTRLDVAATRIDGQPVAGDRTVVLSDARQNPVVGWVVVLAGAQKGKDFRLHEGKNSVGSASDAEVSLRDPAVSQKHASISYKDGKFVLVDLDSTNGTFVNSGADPVARIELADNDILRLGETTLKFKCL